MIEFEIKTEEEQIMLQDVGNFLNEIIDTYGKDDLIKNITENKIPGTLISDVLNRVMTGDLAKHLGMFFSGSKSAIPVKTDTVRLLFMYLDAVLDKDMGIPKLMYTFNAVKYGVTAMGLAAISSGKDGTKLIMNKYLPELMQGASFCYCITEPDAGTNTHKISTTAVEEGDFYVLSGQKTYISAADIAKHMVVVAKIISGDQQTGIGTFIVDAKLSGISMTPMDIAALGDEQFTVYFDDVKIPRDSLVGSKKASKEGGISESVFYTLNLERIFIAYIMLRVCREVLAKAVEKAGQQRASGVPMGQYQNIKLKLAKAKLHLELANLATRKATRAYDQKGVPKTVGMHANMAKLVATQAANEACDAALNIYGAAGLNKESDIGPLCQIARLFRIAPINDEMVLNFLGEHYLGLPKSYR